eukprot:TRINITY_DN3606_c0_g1_i2.p2 TRINITY_DN3606_c0_g1~~TRINITY_DN3606_c0_g1_i2.p2  ORF type:complete len:109 (-),score=35.99 TRINITY_DN3606_c0_g1_i2:98-424(-)
MIDQPEKEAVVSTQSTGEVQATWEVGAVVVVVAALTKDGVEIRVDKEVGMTGIPLGAVLQTGRDQTFGKVQGQMTDLPEKNHTVSSMMMMMIMTFGNGETPQRYFLVK